MNADNDVGGMCGEHALHAGQRGTNVGPADGWHTKQAICRPELRRISLWAGIDPPGIVLRQRVEWEGVIVFPHIYEFNGKLIRVALL